MEFHPTREILFVLYSYTGTSTDTLVWTDNANAVMITRCVMEKYGDWKVLSPEPVLSPKTREEILGKVRELGLDASGYEK